jgi:hypothetical protein
MSYYEELRSECYDGKLKIIHIEAVPRSISTALGRAINESGAKSVYINEPFNRRQYDIEKASENILKVTDKIKYSKEDPLTVVTKNMARNLTLSIFEKWMEVCEGVVWSIRDPLVQMASMATRIANDLATGRGTDFFEQDQLDKHLDKISYFLDNGDVSKNFSKTSWQDIDIHFKSKHRPTKSIVVDGAEFIENPETILRHICDLFDLPFSKKMIDGWENGYINANDGYNKNLDTSKNAWTRHATESTGIVKISRKPLDLTKLPKRLHDHIVNVAIPVYEEMIKE